MKDGWVPNGPPSHEGADASGPGANWRTMMATFVTRLERDHEALLEALRERLDETEARTRALEARVAELEASTGARAADPARNGLEARLGALETGAAQAGEADAIGRVELRLSALEEGLGRRPDLPAAAAPAAVALPRAQTAPGAASAGGESPDPDAASVALSPEAARRAQTPAGAAAPAPWEEAGQAMLQRESEVLARAARGDAPRDIAAALGRGLGEVELVLRLAERAGHGGRRYRTETGGGH